MNVKTMFALSTIAAPMLRPARSAAARGCPFSGQWGYASVESKHTELERDPSAPDPGGGAG
jgi:hypothetical protein